MRMFNTLIDVDVPALSLARVARNGGVTEVASRVMESVRRAPQPFKPSGLRTTFARPMFAGALSHVVVSRGSRR